MRLGVSPYNSAFALVLATAAWLPSCASVPSSGLSSRGDLIFDYSPAPPPEQGPPLSASALRDPSYLPAQIGGIVGAYALSLVLVALLLLALSKRRREQLRNRDNPEVFDRFQEFNPFPDPFLLQSEEEYKRQLEEFQAEQEYQNEQYLPDQYQINPFHGGQFQNDPVQKLTLQTDFPRSPIRNFSLPSASPLSPTRIGPGPLSPTKSQRSVFTTSSPASTIPGAGIELFANPEVAAQHRAMAQAQLEEMYKHVMEQEQAKLEGREYLGPPLPAPSSKSISPVTGPGPKKERNKPSNLNLSHEKTESRSSSIFSFLKSPRKNKMSTGTMTISSPIMTPMSGTFPGQDYQEMNAIPPRHYAPPPPPPVPSSDLPFRRAAAAASSAAGSQHLPTPDISPVSTQSIDSRIDAARGQPGPARVSRQRETRDDRPPSHSRDPSSAATTTTEHDPVSASSEKSTSNLVGLPSSPRPGVNRFPSLDSLPASPRPHQQSFQFHPPPAPSNNSSKVSLGAAGNSAPSAVREGGALPLRAYEPSLSSPTAPSYATKQTVFTRGPMSPTGMGGMQTGGLRTPWTGAPVPYTPYQPFSPVVPITPTVVTRADRKRMKKFEPRTPTVEMVRDEEDIW